MLVKLVIYVLHNIALVSTKVLLSSEAKPQRPTPKQEKTGLHNFFDDLSTSLLSTPLYIIISVVKQLKSAFSTVDIDMKYVPAFANIQRTSQTTLDDFMVLLNDYARSLNEVNLTSKLSFNQLSRLFEGTART